MGKVSVVGVVIGVALMLVIVCGMLLLLYFFYYPMGESCDCHVTCNATPPPTVYIALGLFSIAAVAALFNFFSPFVASIPLINDKWRYSMYIRTSIPEEVRHAYRSIKTCQRSLLF